MIRVESARDQVNVAKVYEVGQEQIFEYWDEIGPDERKSLLEQIASIDFAEFARLLKTHDSAANEEDDPAPTLGELKPAPLIEIPRTAEQLAGRDAAEEAGIEKIKAGKVGILLVAGGQGTRLGFEGPKGCYPLGMITDRTLFQFHAEKIVSLQRRHKTTLPWIIMTSESNHEETRSFFLDNHFFGLNPPDVIFEKQAMLPIVDPRRGKILLESKSTIALSPNGHGGAIGVIKRLRETLERRRIEYLFTYQVDNPMVRMADPVFIGHHVLADSQFSSKATPKRDPEEKVGVFCLAGGSLRVVEYTELGERERFAREEDGKLAFRAGNIAQHVISVDFINPTESDSSFDMPYHVAKKAVACLRDGETVKPTEPNSIRFESFLFDVGPYARNPIVLEVDRDLEFAPVKNAEGEDSPATAQAAMAKEWIRWLGSIQKEIPGIQVEANGDLPHVKGRIEISPLFASGPQELAERLEGRDLEVEDGLLLE